MPIAAEAAPDLTANPFTDAAIPAAEPPAISAVPAPPAAPAAAPAYSPAGDVGMPAAAAMTAPQYAEELPAAPVAMGAPAPYEVPEVVAPVYKLADWAPRVGAQLVDNIIIVGVAYAIIIFAGLRASGFAASLLVYLAAVTAYSATQLTYNNGQTLGKRMFKLRVVREDGKPIELGYAMYRETFAKGLLWCIPIYPLIDGTNPTRDEQNRAICDKIVKSRVVEA
jgi:hypothetical protein